MLTTRARARLAVRLHAAWAAAARPHDPIDEWRRYDAAVPPTATA